MYAKFKARGGRKQENLEEKKKKKEEENRLLKNNEVTDEYLKLAIKDSLKRLIYPSIEKGTIIVYGEGQEQN